MTSTHDPVGSPRAAFLNCPRCGLSIRPKARWLAVEHRPRCLARGRIAVRSVSSPAPAAELYPVGIAPSTDGRAVTTPAGAG